MAQSSEPYSKSLKIDLVSSLLDCAIPAHNVATVGSLGDVRGEEILRELYVTYLFKKDLNGENLYRWKEVRPESTLDQSESEPKSCSDSAVYAFNDPTS